ncbi:MAG: helix-turn-helix transcriptional regulator [Clostridia bacterium]|nr:helix-turn-helix transcriptional regulator [Clostridia bacterium]
MIVKNFKESRELLDLKQKDIADYFSVHFSTVSGWETGKDTIPLERLIEYSNNFGYSLDYLFGITRFNIKYEHLIIDLELIAKNLRLLRKHNKMTQTEVAEKINTTQASYAHYENAVNLIPTAFLYNLTRIYKHFSIDELLGRKKQ